MSMLTPPGSAENSPNHLDNENDSRIFQFPPTGRYFIFLYKQRV
jgi:hypothetical protein